MLEGEKDRDLIFLNRILRKAKQLPLQKEGKI
jgi:hypothetical protein